ncbi:MAG: glycerophosphodiester phosphodiesterase [Ornithinibacter sp.]
MWTRRTPWVALLAGVTLALPAVAFAAGPPVVSAHRALGISRLAENSLAAFTAAARAGETDIEGDARAIKDGTFVMSHDATLRAPRCTGPYLGLSLRTLTAAQVTKMRCSGQPVARLVDVIAAVRPYPAATLRVEVKHYGPDTSSVRSADAVRLATTLGRAGMTARSVLQDFEWATTTKAIHAAVPTQRVSALTSTISVAKVASARSLGAADFSYAHALSTGFWNQLVSAQGLTSTVWAVDEPLRARVLRAEGVGTLISNVPETLRATLDAPGSQCTLSRWSSSSETSRGGDLAAGASTYRYVAALSPDGRTVETVLLRVRATTTSGTASLRVSPKGTAAGSRWEQSVVVGPSGVAVTLEVPGGDAGAVQVRNASSQVVHVSVGSAGGTAWNCP